MRLNRLSLGILVALTVFVGAAALIWIRPATPIVSLKPAGDVGASGVQGVADGAVSSTGLYQDIDDGTAPASADGDTTRVETPDGVATTGFHITSYGGAPAGSVTRVVVNVRAHRTEFASGAVELLLYDGLTLIGTGPVRTLGTSYTTYRETFDDLKVADGNTLRAMVKLVNRVSRGSVSYTQIWLDLAIPAPKSSVSSTPMPASGDLMSRRDLIYGSEIGAWRPNGKPTVDPATGIPALVQAAKIPVMRFALYDCFTDMTCGTDNHPGTETRTDFNAAIDGIRNNLRAEPWLKLIPIADDTIGNVKGTIFCPPLGNLAMNLPFYKAVVAQAGNRVHLYESSNEAEYSCWRAWGYSGAGAFGVSRTLGEQFAQNMPALKKYARNLGIDIKTVGYIGVSGGTGWGQTCTTPRLRSIDEFNNAAHRAYVYSNQDPDYIPDAESIHAYPYPVEFQNASHNCVYQYYKLFAQQWRRELVKIWGPMIGSQIKLSISEWQAGTLSWSGWRTPSTVQAFYAGWFKYVLQGQALADGSVGATERWWSAILFDAATDKDYYDFIMADGTTRPWYGTFKAASLGDPKR